jgi:hypothetical protein
MVGGGTAAALLAPPKLEAEWLEQLPIFYAF